MEFNKSYNRQEFVSFLRNNFLPEDFVLSEEQITLSTKTKYTHSAYKLGYCESLDLVVYEIRHVSKFDARVSLSKEAFRLLADEMEDRALVVFVPNNDNSQYRFSFIEITLQLSKDCTSVHNVYSDPHRYSYLLGEGIAYHTPNKYLNEKGRVCNDEDLRSRFSVDILTKEFYTELSDWYAWAITVIRFPNDINTKEDDIKFNNEGAIRLITRLIFVWFLKQRDLIPEEFFDEKFLSEELLNDFDPHLQLGLFQEKSLESKYYKAILQNLFFAMLNSPITPEGKKSMTERHFRKEEGDYDNNKLMRYKYYFKNPQLFIDLANSKVPFLNGGLFDCLDEKDSGLYYDGFSDRKQIRDSLVIPDYLFFGEEVGRNIDLSEWYGDKKKKKVSARGIIDILKRYNFTVEENTPFDKDVSLDPELLGKVFENLLASFNPETQTTARKQTGSFYTPREVVQYMVNESLLCHLKHTVGEKLEPEFRKLLQYTDDKIQLSIEEKKQVLSSLFNCKILDPACGSGAFPMGILQQMVHILSRIDSNNEMWKDMMLKQAIDETSDVYHTASNEERRDLIADIERSFDENINRPDYARKLYLIENCIYGVDIQPIAIQISKLRFFISLVVDQNTNTDPLDNFGIRPLPNLEAKFVSANTLVSLDRNNSTIFDTESIQGKQEELKLAKHKIFGAKTIRTKRKYRKKVNDLRVEIAQMLGDAGIIGNNESKQLMKWDMFDQNSSSPFFDSEWMFGVENNFDIVIANPPYVLVQSLENEYLKDYYRSHFDVASYKVDLYHLFIERGLGLLSSNGHLCFINPSNFLTNNYTENLRKYLFEKFSFNSVLNIEDNVFTASVNTCIISVDKTHSLNYIFQYQKGNLHHGNLFVTPLSSVPYTEYLKIENVIIQPFVSDERFSLLKKIKTASLPLKDIALVKFGMQLRNRKLYPNDVLSYPDKSKLTEYHRKCLTGKNIVPYSSRFDGLYCYYNEVAKCGGCWDHNVHDTKVKVLVRQVGSTPVCGIDTHAYAILNSAFMIITESVSPYFLMALINSKLMKFYWTNVFEDKRKTFPKIKGSYLEMIPVILPLDNRIAMLAENISSRLYDNPDENVESELNEIDLLFYKLYGLNYNEILLVDPDTTIKCENY